MKFICRFALALTWILFLGCRKPKPVLFSGQLLLTKKNPIPLSNKGIEIYQPGASAIIFASLSSTATTFTNEGGFFSMIFTPGSAFFGAFSGENNSALTFSSALNDRSFPTFYQRNFPLATYDAFTPIFIGKSIDTLIIKVNCLKAVTVTDTLALKGNQIAASFDKEYTGITADSGTIFTLDTISKALFTDFDYTNNTFSNTILFGRIKTNAGNRIFNGYSINDAIPDEDELKKEITFYLND